MAIQTKIVVRKDTINKSTYASAMVVNLQEMDFDAFCEYLAQDSTVGAADVAADEERLECHSVTWLYLEGATLLGEYAEEGFVLGHAFFDLLVIASLSNRRCTRSCSL